MKFLANASMLFILCILGVAYHSSAKAEETVFNDIPDSDYLKKHLTVLLEEAQSGFKKYKGEYIKGREKGEEIGGSYYPAYTSHRSTYSIGVKNSRVGHTKFRQDEHYDYYGHYTDNITFKGEEECSFSCMMSSKSNEAPMDPLSKIKATIDETVPKDWIKTVEKTRWNTIYKWKECSGNRGREIKVSDRTRFTNGHLYLIVGKYSKLCM